MHILFCSLINELFFLNKVLTKDNCDFMNSSWAADGLLQACHVKLVMTMSLYVLSTVATHKNPH